MRKLALVHVSSDADDHISPTRTALPSRVRLGVPSQSHRDLPIRARIHRPTSCFLARAPAMSARTLGAATRADPPVQNTHRPRGKLGVPGRSHQDLPIRAEKHRSARRSFARARAAANMRPHPVPPPAGPVRTTHRPRGKLGVPGRSHRDLPIRAEKHRSARLSDVARTGRAFTGFTLTRLLGDSKGRQAGERADSVTISVRVGASCFSLQVSVPTLRRPQCRGSAAGLRNLFPACVRHYKTDNTRLLQAQARATK